jgi:hypothetical protein
MNKVSEPVFLTQKDASGQPEKVDVTRLSIKVVCSEPECAEIRYIHPQDKAQSKFCKPHARLHRLASRAKRARDRRARNKVGKGQV